MCTELTMELEEGSTVVSTQGELAALIGEGSLVLHTGYSPKCLDPDSCLCPIDLHRSLVEYDIERDDTGECHARRRA